MNYFIDWLIPYKLLYVRWPVEVTLEMLSEANHEILQHMTFGARYNDSVHLMIDARDTMKMPLNMTKVRLAMTAYNQPSCGWVWTLSDDQMISFLISSMPQLVSYVRSKIFTDIDQMFKFMQGIAPEFTHDNMNLALLEGATVPSSAMWWQ